MQKKAVVITRHAVTNYGSLLQAIATQKIVEKYNYECKILNYIRRDEYLANSTFTVARNSKKWGKNILLFLIYCIIRYPENLFSNFKFSLMRKKYLNMTKMVSDTADLRNIKADLYITGSDQVWGKTLAGCYDLNYFLQFCETDSKKISISSSFGNTDFDSIGDNIVELLSDYDYLTVREKEPINWLKSKKLYADQLIDPTLMFNKKEWFDILKIDESKIKEKNILLVFQIHDNKEFEKYTRDLAKNNGLRLVRVSSSFHQIFNGGRYIAIPSLEKFIYYLLCAKYIVTDSFHVTAFAINFNKTFATYLPKTGTESRITNLLEKLDLKYRIINSTNNSSMVLSSIQYDKVNERLNDERKKAYKILDNVFKAVQK